MLNRVQPSADDANIVFDLHTPGINVTMAAGKLIRVTVQNLSFELDCTQGVKLVDNPAMRFQLSSLFGPWLSTVSTQSFAGAPDIRILRRYAISRRDVA